MCRSYPNVTITTAFRDYGIAHMFLYIALTLPATRFAISQKNPAAFAP